MSRLGLVADSGQYAAPLISHTRHTLSSLLFFFSYVTSFAKLLLCFSIDSFNKEIQCGQLDPRYKIPLPDHKQVVGVPAPVAINQVATYISTVY